MQINRSAWGMSFFCDDARQEIGGKFSLMGIYQTDMVFHPDATFPISIPKLAIFVRYFEVKGEMDGDLSLKLYFPAQEDPVFSMQIRRGVIINAPTPYAPDGDSEAIYTVMWPIMLSPATFLGEGPIKVRAQCGDKKIRLGRLMVRKATPDEYAILFPNASPQPSSQSPPAAPAT